MRGEGLGIHPKPSYSKAPSPGKPAGPEASETLETLSPEPYTLNPKPFTSPTTRSLKSPESLDLRTRNPEAPSLKSLSSLSFVALKPQIPEP